MSDNGLFAGIDGGGTKTAIVVVNRSGTEVARHRTTSSNPSVVGFDEAAQVLTSLLETAARQANASLPFAGAWFGLSGFDRPTDRARLGPALSSSVREIILTNDAELVLAALPDSVGVALIAGTGSIALGRNASGESARAGGWGHLFGDEGSGYELGRRALRAIAEQTDGRGPETMLTVLLMEIWELDDPFGIITRAYDKETAKGGIAALSHLVIHAARDGDAVATAILNDAINDIHDLAAVVAQRLGFVESLPLAMTGGLLLNVAEIRDGLIDRLAQTWDITANVAVSDPATAAAHAMASRVTRVPGEIQSVKGAQTA